jgi:hypothetical protein
LVFCAMTVFGRKARYYPFRVNHVIPFLDKHKLA